MTKKEVDLCDGCNKVIAKTKCEFCKRDLCDSCISTLSLEIEGIDDNKTLFNFDSCKDCSWLISSADLKEDFRNYPELKKQFIEIFKRILELGELEGKRRPKTKAIPSGPYNIGLGNLTHTPINPIIPSPYKKTYPKTYPYRIQSSGKKKNIKYW